MGNINFGNQKENIQENAGSIFTGDMPQEKADSFAGAIPQPQGYAGGYGEGRDPCKSSSSKSQFKCSSSAGRKPGYKESPDHRRRYRRNPDGS